MILMFHTELTLVTFVFICIEILILFYLLIHWCARPDEKQNSYNIILISLLLIYNITGGLLPDKRLPGSLFLQNSVAFFTGFITPAFFPMYFYRNFGLKKLKFHAYRGVFYFIVIPYFLFLLLYATTGGTLIAQGAFIIPLSYGIWLVFIISRSLAEKYRNTHRPQKTIQKTALALFTMTPWVALPLISIFDLGQTFEALATNPCFLLLLGLQLREHVLNTRREHERLLLSEKELQKMNDTLKREVSKKTKKLEAINEQRINTFINVAHETKTPLTLIGNYLDEYLKKKEVTEELVIIKNNINKLTNDIVNFFDIEKLQRNKLIYQNNQNCNFSNILEEMVSLFGPTMAKNEIQIFANIEKNLKIKADPDAIIRVICNIMENAYKFSPNQGKIYVDLKQVMDSVYFSVKDQGCGIPLSEQEEIFKPYYQLNLNSISNKGMGMGLPLIKEILLNIEGKISIESNPNLKHGTKIVVVMPLAGEKEPLEAPNVKYPEIILPDKIDPKEIDFFVGFDKKTIVLVEDNLPMAKYLSMKIKEFYNVYHASNGGEAIKKLKRLPIVPDLVISDIMMQKMDGFSFLKYLKNSEFYKHIPLFVLTAKTLKEDKIKGLKMGAFDYLEKPFSMEEMLLKIDTVLKNIDLEREALVNSLIQSSLNQNRYPEYHQNLFEENCKQFGFTNREIEIALLVKEGLKNKEIGERLYISEGTVLKHVQHIYAKAKASGRTDFLNKFQKEVPL